MPGGFVLEQTLGHVTHSRNLQQAIVSDGRFEPHFVPIEFHGGTWTDRLPMGRLSWTVRSAPKARRAVRRLRSRHGVEVLLFHTHVPAMLLGRTLRGTPHVVSIDATPLQVDRMAEPYGHRVAGRAVERVKHRLHRRCFHRATHLVTWSQWAKDGLVAEYGVAPERVTVIPPGVRTELWSRAEEGEPRADGEVRILFVGGDFERKGGPVLLEALDVVRARLREQGATTRVHLDVVTGSAVPAHDAVAVHRGLAANSPELIARYHAADIFCLPTWGDCLPMVLAEAGASGLALVATDVGGIPELVQPGTTGELVAPGDAVALADALLGLVLDRGRREAYGHAARRLVLADHDVSANAARLVDLLRDLARP